MAHKKINKIKGDNKMKRLLKKFETAMTAASFAEAGEHGTAREIMREGKRTRKADRVAPRPRKQLRA